MAVVVLFLEELDSPDLCVSGLSSLSAFPPPPAHLSLGGWLEAWEGFLAADLGSSPIPWAPSFTVLGVPLVNKRLPAPVMDCGILGPKGRGRGGKQDTDLAT